MDLFQKKPASFLLASKLVKAEQLGIKIISEEEFLGMVKSSDQ